MNMTTLYLICGTLLAFVAAVLISAHVHFRKYEKNKKENQNGESEHRNVCNNCTWYIFRRIIFVSTKTNVKITVESI